MNKILNNLVRLELLFTYIPIVGMRLKKYLLLIFQLLLFSNISITQPYDVVWTNLVGVTANGSTITATSGGWGNSGGASTNVLSAGASGYVEVIAGPANSFRMIGLSPSNLNASYSSINYAVYLTNDGTLIVYESGFLKYASASGAYQSIDLIRVERTGTQITYKKNNVTFYTSTLNSSTSLIVDVAFYSNGAVFANVKTSFPVPGIGNTTPTISFIAPTSGSSFPVGQSVILNATATDPGGSISNVQFYDGVTLLGQVNTSPFTFSTSTLTTGTHSLTAKATDNLGATTTSSPPVSITINAATCTDGVQNGIETGIDCGGTCLVCGGVSGNAWSGTTTNVPVYRTGRVHIGQANTITGMETAYGLYVIGGIKTDKMKIELSSGGAWADYIFDNDYHLIPILELQHFIKEHHHLPGFPSESTLKQEGGIEIGDMIKRQQAGIEKLYLYIIELEQKTEKLVELERKLEILEIKLKNE